MLPRRSSRERLRGFNTAVMSHVEVSSALAKAARRGLLARNEALSSYESFENEWPDFVRLQITEFVMERAARLAWEYDLRRYDAVHLAAALIWPEAMDAPVTMAVFDRRLWAAGKQAGLIPFNKSGSLQTLSEMTRAGREPARRTLTLRLPTCQVLIVWIIIAM